MVVFPDRRDRAPYRRGFFFGPGRPRARAAGSAWPLARLLPGLGPGTPFRRGVSPGVAPVAGVEVASRSEPLSADEGRTGAVPADEAGEERSWVFARRVGLDGLRSGPSAANCWRTAGGSFKVIINEPADLDPAARLARPAVEAAGIMTDVFGRVRDGREGKWRRGDRGVLFPQIIHR